MNIIACTGNQCALACPMHVHVHIHSLCMSVYIPIHTDCIQHIIEPINEGHDIHNVHLHDLPACRFGDHCQCDSEEAVTRLCP